MKTRLLWIGLVPWLSWCGAAVWLGGVGPDSWPWLRAVVLLGAAGTLAAGLWRGVGLRVGAVLAVGITAWYLSLRPSHHRDWTEDQSRLPRIERDGDRLTVRNLRRFRYQTVDDWDAAWTDTTWDLSTLQGVDFAVERFTDNEAVAHTLVSFTFADAEPLAVSVEIRKERGESYGPVRGLFKQYELMYVLADERDVLELRAVHRDDPTFLHPMAATPAQARAFLDVLLDGAQGIEHRPRFYDTLTASCTTVLAWHLVEVFDLDLDHRAALPGYSDQLAFELGLIDTALDFEATRATNQINAAARQAAGTPAFSDAIRRGRTDGP